MDSIKDFYDNLANEYHLIFEDWNKAVLWQGEVLSKFVSLRLPDLNKSDISLLDCSCGIGTQAIGLRKKGFNVTATDLSPVSIKRAKEESQSSNVNIKFGVADFRSLKTDVAGLFDVVLSADNAISHMLTNDDLLLAVENMYSKLNNRGVILLTLKDYDKLLKENPSVTQPHLLDNGRRVVFQKWDWHSNKKVYTLNHFILKEINGEWEMNHNKTKYRALLRDELNKALNEVGFSNIKWYMPEESGYYQPFLLAEKYN